MDEVLFRDVRPHGGALRSVLVKDGVIATVAAPDQIQPTSDCAVVEGNACLALPLLVDAHIHPDKTSWGSPWLSRAPAQTLAELIANDVRTQLAMKTPVETRAGELMTAAVVHGTRAMRAHVDVAPEYGLGNVAGVQAAAQRLRGLLDVQIVAFPQLGLVSHPGTLALLIEAISAGVDVVGGIDPLGVDKDVRGHLDAIFGVADRTGVGIDVHLHDGGEPGLDQVEEIARRTRTLGLQGKVIISHAFCVAEADPQRLSGLCALLAEAGVALVTCALGVDAVLPLGPLLDSGVRVGLGSDGVRDAWTPFGNADMIERAFLLAYRTDAATDQALATCYDLASVRSASVLGLPEAHLREGDPADFLLVPGECVPQIVVDRPSTRRVVRAGRIIAEDGRLTNPHSFASDPHLFA